MNRFYLLGRIAKMETTYNQKDNSPILNLSIIDNKNSEKNGVKQFYNCVAFKKQAKIIGDLAGVGDRISISGHLQWQEWDKNGVILKVLKVLIDEFELSGKAYKKEMNPFKTDA